MKSTANPPLASLYQNGQGAGSTAPHPDHLGKNRVLFESSFIRSFVYSRLGLRADGRNEECFPRVFT
jgi:hypothetical protein